MSVHTRQDLERLSRFTRQRYSRALMSDIKWRKFFAAVNGSGWHPSFVEVKFVGSGEPETRLMRFPNQDNFWGPPQWVDTSEFGPIELRSIEWLMIPAIVADRSNLGGASSSGVPQDLEAIRTALSQAGQFPLEDVPEGLRIVGYR
jgi:hypothetical protein